MGLAWLALDAAIFRESARNLRDMERVSSFHRDYRDFSEAEALLKEGSDRLTQAVRRFAATGFPRFIEDYENEEKVDRNRERALAIIDAKLPPDHPARDAMHEAMARSLALQDVEHCAMRLVAEAFGMDVEGLPEHLRQVVLSPEEAALDAAGKRQRAFDLLYSDDYFAAKAGIWARVQEFLDHTIGRTADDFDAASQSAIRSTNRQMILFTLALAVVFGALILSASVGYAMFARMTRKNLGLMDDLRQIGNVKVLDIETMAKENNVPRSANVILLGAAQKALGIEYSKLEDAIRRVFGRKGEAIVEANIKALALGRDSK